MGNNSSTSLTSTQVSMADFQTYQDIGKGAFGKVCVVKHIQRQEHYALKIISKSHCIKTNKSRHVVRERMLLEQLDHPLLINLRYAFQDEHYLYMAMDLMLGGDLRHYLTRNGPASEELTRFWMTEMICAIKYLHSKEIMHRDIKPENILLDMKGHVHLTDFNIATRIRHTTDRLLTSPSGTLAYFAPELVKGYGYTEDVDWWCLGLTFYECIFGKRPWREYEGKEDILNQIVRGYIPYPMQENNTISGDCLSSLQGFLEIDPIYRLGHGENGWKRILHHPFFSNTPWQQINTKNGIPPPSFNTQHISDSILPGNTGTITKNLNSLHLSTIISSSPTMPALSKHTNSIPSVPSMHEKTNNNFNNDDKNGNEGWLKAIYDFILPPSESKDEEQQAYQEILADRRSSQRLEELESSFTFFDWTIYDEYQGFMNKETLSVGSPPPWVKPAFTDADNGRILPVASISTTYEQQQQQQYSTMTDDDLLVTPPTTPTTDSFPHIVSTSYHESPYDHHQPLSTSKLHLSQQQQQQKKQRRKSGTKYFNERREWERRKSLGTTCKNIHVA
ncbi:kinase-like domain-containing protein [Halteromyces radiatus]|uniref:kinase-like domain-containing protein n=1 Tax=Halteromyces radiatus TaxID=101107 RepID=UPI00221F60C1|nr:kinase-like domain-containing protein [Halteromyces radiatus]KAI8098826.1 kinase-like domain-containing protein [Halteromyces radiatus]